jgi:hypothetical protein
VSCHALKRKRLLRFQARTVPCLLLFPSALRIKASFLSIVTTGASLQTQFWFFLHSPVLPLGSAGHVKAAGM